ncbi:MAG: hypothetical protein LBH60_04090 [Prevotellaceae bacterium]|jgi:hypothetical protein|nr:hypothetical protein [Prevotellaceae bacterium]
MARKIEVSIGDNKRLCEMLGCSHVAVTKALRGFDRTLLALRIRKAAKEIGGREIKEVVYVKEEAGNERGH